MKQLEDESRSDRVIEIETDDEEDEAERNCEDDEEDTESDSPSRYYSANNNDSLPWPQSYRQSMDMYTSVTPTVSFLNRSSSMTSVTRRSQIGGFESSLSRALISETSLEREDVPTSTLPVRLSVTSGSSSYISELSPPKQCSYLQSLLNAINGLCGIGILSTPYALKEGGWFGLFLLLIFGIITCYTGILLKRCLESSPGLQTYPDVGQAAFGMAGRVCIAVVLYMELYSSCVEFLIMMSDNLSSMFPHFHVNLAGVHLDSYQAWAIISTVVILPTALLPNLKQLSYVSVGGVILLMAVTFCMLWVGVSNEVGFHMGGTALNFAKLPVTIGIYSFCYGSHSVFPNIYTSMEEPSRFPSILLISFSTACALYAGVAICGFLMFGDSTKSQFTLSLPRKYPASIVAAWAVVLTPLTKYALSLTPVACGLEELLPVALVNKAVTVLIRTVLVVSTLVIALTVPYFGSLMALIGSLLVMLVSVIFPCACYMKISSRNLTNTQIAVCTLITVVGVVCAIAGTYSSITNVADQLQS